MVDPRRWLGGVRVRTTAAATLVVGAALTLVGVLLVLLLQRWLTGDIRTGAELRAQDVVDVLDAGRPPGALAVDNPEESLIQVIDRAGAVVAASANITSRPPIADLRPGAVGEVRQLPIGDEHAYLVVALGSADGRYIVLVARTLDPVTETAAFLTGALAVGIPALVVLVAITTWTVTGLALRPVEAIRREVSAISDAQLGRRVPEPAGGDEVARLARTMNAMLDRLAAASDRQRRFASDASHELRSPIASVRHQLEMALAHPELTSVTELAAGLLAEDLRLEGLVTDLLLLARADEGGTAGQRQPVDLDDLVLAEAARLRRRGQVAVDTSGVGAAQLDGDPVQLTRLVRNLADNAERHAARAVSLAVTTRSDRLVLTVADDGAGVPTADRERIFERFTRLDDARARDTGGVGLGLAIVAEVARAHGGRAYVEDGPEARFVVELPGLDAFSVG